MTPAMAQACRLIKTLGLVPSFRNLYVIELAITAESDFSSTPLPQATDQIISDARSGRQMGEHIDYFWFEDECWRHPKLTFKQRDEIRMREKAAWR